MKIAVSGATGRMGKLIIKAVINSDDLKLVAAVTAPGVAEIGRRCVARENHRNLDLCQC